MAAPFSQVPHNALKAPTPFKVSIPDAEIEGFQQLLKLSRLPKPTYESLQEDGRFGVSRKWLSEAKGEWEGFDWKKSEAHMNTFPHFTTPISSGSSTLTIHFVALFSQKADAIPLILLHGWPGNFLEFLPILSLLKAKYTPDTLPYHVVVPSVPGYAFSDAPPLDRTFNTKDVAAVMHRLMVDLGFEGGYVAQGGDIGARIATQLGSLSESCKAVHLNFCPVLTPPPGFDISTLNARDKAGLERAEDFRKMGSGYREEHATRPATIGLALDSSPLALLAWIGEKFLAWTDEDPSLETILESVSLYWYTESMGRGIYPYRERLDPNFTAPPKLLKPTGYSNFPKEIMPAPRKWVAEDVNLVWYKEHEKGGHFAALEQPELLWADVEDFVKQVWGK